MLNNIRLINNSYQIFINICLFDNSASEHRFMLGAELLGLKKEYKDGTLRDFSCSDGFNFKHYHGKL